MLIQFEACQEQLDLFDQLFPDGGEITRANYQQARALDLVWWVEKTDVHSGVRSRFLQRVLALRVRYEDRVGLLQTWLSTGHITYAQYIQERGRIYDILTRRIAWHLAEELALPEDGTEEPEIL